MMGKKDVYPFIISFVHLSVLIPVCLWSLQDLPRPEMAKDATQSLLWSVTWSSNTSELHHPVW